MNAVEAREKALSNINKLLWEQLDERVRAAIERAVREEMLSAEVPADGLDIGNVCDRLRSLGFDYNYNKHRDVLEIDW